MEEMKIHTAGDSSVLIEFGQEISPKINAKITAFVHLMKAQHVEGVKDMIPAFTSLLINYDPRVVNYSALKERLEKLLKLEVSQETIRITFRISASRPMTGSSFCSLAFSTRSSPYLFKVS